MSDEITAARDSELKELEEDLQAESTRHKDAKEKISKLKNYVRELFGDDVLACFLINNVVNPEVTTVEEKEVEAYFCSFFKEEDLQDPVIRAQVKDIEWVLSADTSDMAHNALFSVLKMARQFGGTQEL
jgi:hypothetical protein